MKKATSTRFILTDSEVKTLSDTKNLLITMMNELDKTEVEALETVCTALEAVREVWYSDFVDTEE